MSSNFGASTDVILAPSPGICVSLLIEIVPCLSCLYQAQTLLLEFNHYYRPQTKFAKVMFLHLSVSHSVHRGGMHGCRGVCVVAGGHAWLWRACVVAGGMHGCREGACMVVGGCAWLQGVCMVVGGMRGCRGVCIAAGRGMHGCGGVCMVVGGMHGCGGHVWFGGHVWLLGVCVVVGGYAWLWGVCMVVGGMCGCGGGMRGIRQDTVNERAVRILLECILVCNMFS